MLPRSIACSYRLFLGKAIPISVSTPLAADITVPDQGTTRTILHAEHDSDQQRDKPLSLGVVNGAPL